MDFPVQSFPIHPLSTETPSRMPFPRGTAALGTTLVEFPSSVTVTCQVTRQSRQLSGCPSEGAESLGSKVMSRRRAGIRVSTRTFRSDKACLVNVLAN